MANTLFFHPNTKLIFKIKFVFFAFQNIDPCASELHKNIKLVRLIDPEICKKQIFPV